MLNEIFAKGVSHDGYVTIFRHSGATSEQLKEYVNVVIERKPRIMICHIGTNDITNNVETIQNLQTIINRTKKKSPATKFAISFTLYDKPGSATKVENLNTCLRECCNENLVDYICNKNIDATCLGKAQLHPNKKGKSIFAKNLKNYVQSQK